jgi:N-succinyldiaminopimelate aminotransferase
MNPYLQKLQPYPFEKLSALKAGVSPPADLPHIALSIGEPKHPAPEFVLEALCASLDGLSQYPLTRGIPELREAIARWLERRFQLGIKTVDAETQVLPVNGTREALFAFAQAIVNAQANETVLMPNPFYQIYEGAAYLAGATPVFYNTTAATGYVPDFDAISDAQWRDCRLLYICSPGNPSGAVIPRQTLIDLIAKARQFDFIIASDECYSEIYFDEASPPAGLLEAALACGNTVFENCVVFHSLSKRSNLPGLRSGFVAGDANVLKQFLLYRTYHVCAMSPIVQHASISAWNNEQHVIDNRKLYLQKFDAVIDILSPVIKVNRPDAAFYLWLQTPMDDTEFTRQLFAQQNVTVLPGSYLSREANGRSGLENPGSGHVRMALVAPLEECISAAKRIREFIETKA